MNSDGIDYGRIRAALEQLHDGSDTVYSPASVGLISGHTTKQAYAAMQALVGEPFDFLEEHWFHAESRVRLDPDEVAKVFVLEPFRIERDGADPIDVESPATECAVNFTLTEQGDRVFAGKD